MPSFNLQFWLSAISHISVRYLVLTLTAFVIFYLILPKQMQARRIQQKFPSLKHYSRDLGFSLLSIAIFATIFYITVFSFKGINNFLAEPFGNRPWWYHAVSVLWMFVLHDAWFYLIHRLMHTRLLFKRVHLVHHLSTNPSPFTAYAFHPLEAVLEAGIIPLVAFTLPVNLKLFAFFMLFQIIYNVYGHLGYELLPRRFKNTVMARWMNTGIAHNQHHKYFSGNYGLYTLLWDRIFGTVRKDYDKALMNFNQEKPILEGITKSSV